MKDQVAADTAACVDIGASGWRPARGDLILMMDADLQDDPAEIPALLEQMELGADVVNGWKQDGDQTRGRIARIR